jgi:lipopolysaccharide export system permease protein
MSSYRVFSPQLSKYLFREVGVSFFSGATIFLFIMLMFQAIRLSDFVVVHQVSLTDVGKLSLSLMLSFLPIAVPVAFLFAVIVGISRANSEGEILALQTSGIGLSHIFFPLAVFSLGVTAFCLYTSLYTVPKGNRSFEVLYTKLANERVMAALKPGVFVEGFFGLTLFAEQVVPEKNEMSRVFIYDEREGAHPMAITAAAGILKVQPEVGALTLRLTNGTIHVDQRALEPVLQKIDFKVYDINLEMAANGEAWRGYSPPSYNYNQLKQRIAETEPDPPTQRGLLVELHRRFSLSFACLVFAALGFSMGISSQRGVRSSSILFCLLTGVVYWLAYLSAISLASAGKVPPWLGVWVPNFIFGGIAYWLFRRYGRA